jgi:predicted nucleic acid-binding protein
VVIPNGVIEEVMAASNRYGQTELAQAIAAHRVLVYHVYHGEFAYGKVSPRRTKELNAHVAILDDKMARQFASTLTVSTIGTVGILRLVKQCHLISEVKSRSDHSLVPAMADILEKLSGRSFDDIVPEVNDEEGQ